MGHNDEARNKRINDLLDTIEREYPNWASAEAQIDLQLIVAENPEIVINRISRMSQNIQQSIMRLLRDAKIFDSRIENLALAWMNSPNEDFYMTAAYYLAEMDSQYTEFAIRKMQQSESKNKLHLWHQAGLAAGRLINVRQQKLMTELNKQFAEIFRIRG